VFKIKRWIFKRLVPRSKLRKWLQLEDIRQAIQEAADDSDTDQISSYLCRYLSAAICRGEWEKLGWKDVALDFYFCVQRDSPSTQYPIFSSKSTKKKDERFKYKDHSWYMWAHLFADAYGWPLDKISKLDIDDAISLIQEILFDEQLKREWDWSLSEKSISYNPGTKTSKFIPLDRPKWMVPEKPKMGQIKTKIPMNMIPVGNVVSWQPDDVKH
jgi:hypothetical protein